MRQTFIITMSDGPPMKRLSLIFNLRTILIALASVATTWLCIRYQITASFPMAMIVAAIVFPLAFSINSAYERRENALGHYASLKTEGRSIYYASRDWQTEPSPESLAHLRKLLRDIMDHTITLLTDPRVNVERNESRVYADFSALSYYIRTDLRGEGMAATEVSRVNNFLNSMLGAFEGLKHIYQYRTPRTLKTFADIFVMLVPPLYGPHFANLAIKYSLGYGLEYLMPILSAILLSSLANIQDQLEDPFDQFGEDDLIFNTEKYINSIAKDS
jgi:hypothetical protein